MEKIETVLNSLNEFTDRISREGITKIVFAETNEKRAVATSPGELSVDSYRLLELIAYKKPSLFKVKIQDPDFDAVYKELESKGFEITKTVRNIT